MAKRKPDDVTKAAPGLESVSDYRHPEAKRKNNPPAKIAAEGKVPLLPKSEYSYSPRLAPELRWDPTGASDELPELLAKATRQPLNEAEAWTLAHALGQHQPWLEWAGKRETRGFSVDPVALHIHERVSAQAILKVAAREDVYRSLFADPEQDYNEAVQFYRHDVDWSNRLILGDSLQVMSSLARREDLAGKVQMIYIDPPYGIKFGSNFQPEIGKREVRDRESDITREPEMVKAYRDTWTLGVHSYLAYLKGRLTVAKDLLSDAGSVFVQIGDENVHLVRNLMDEVFGRENFICLITLRKTTSATNLFLPGVADYILWYARNRQQTKYRAIYLEKGLDGGAEHYGGVELHNGVRRTLSRDERADTALPVGARLFTAGDLQSASMGRDKGEGAACWFPVEVVGRRFVPNLKNRWKTNESGMSRLIGAERVLAQDEALRYVRYIDDFPVYSLNNVWADIGGAADRRYIVETAMKIVERCMLMTTDPGDLVLDPTCGSGTTANAAEQWGHRWISIDTSRVAIAIARQRLVTARYDYCKLRDESKGVSGGFRCRTVPHVTLKSIAQNANLDPIFAKHKLNIEESLIAANTALTAAPEKLRTNLRIKLQLTQKRSGKKSVTDVDRRRWDLPAKGHGWRHWEVPFDADPDYPEALQNAVEGYRAAWRAKMDEVNACIAANAEQEELVDQPEVDRKITRVSGPFTVEAVQPPEMSLGDAIEINAGEFSGEPNELAETFTSREVQAGEPAANIEAYLNQMVTLLRADGVRFPNNKQMKFSRLDAIYMDGSSGIHAEGRWVNTEENDEDPQGRANLGVVIGPQYGPITAKMVEQVIKPAARRYDDLVFAGFSFDGPAQAVIEEATHPQLRMHIAHIRPDVNPGMNGLLKEQPGSQLFTVFGQPRTKLDGPDADGMFTVVMEGVDVYDPLTNSVFDTGASKVAAWFLDSDYDGRTFCITQAFFPDPTAWEKLSKALKGVVDPERFEALSGTTSLPFPAGRHKTAAVKVIDPRGNEVMRVHALEGRRG